jgi:peptide chain release factor 1
MSPVGATSFTSITFIQSDWSRENTVKIAIEIRPGEGGEDAKLLTREQAAIYIAYAGRHNLAIDIENDGRSWLTIVVDGNETAVRLLLREAGGHRWQRVPPTERNGRIHTSTVTVAAMPLSAPKEYKLKDSDVEVFTTRDSGPGGQHRNKTESCVVMRHKPTGIEAKAATKSQHRNKVLARQVLEARVSAHFAAIDGAKDARNRREQVGSGMRGDKIRTYRVRDDQVTDHRSGAKARLQMIMEGKLEDFA